MNSIDNLILELWKCQNIEDKEEMKKADALIKILSCMRDNMEVSLPHINEAAKIQYNLSAYDFYRHAIRVIDADEVIQIIDEVYKINPKIT